MSERARWSEFKNRNRERLESADGRAGYQQAARAHELGVQIRALREARGLSQAQLAKCAGTSQAAIARLEAGGVEPTLRTLDKVGAALSAELAVRFMDHSGIVSSSTARQ